MMKRVLAVSLLLLSGCSIRATASLETGDATQGTQAIIKDEKNVNNDNSTLFNGIINGLWNNDKTETPAPVVAPASEL